MQAFSSKFIFNKLYVPFFFFSKKNNLNFSEITALLSKLSQTQAKTAISLELKQFLENSLNEYDKDVKNKKKLIYLKKI